MNYEKLNGYGMIRTCGIGYKIGPLFAETTEIAESIFLLLISKVKPNQPVYLDVPFINDAGIKLTEKFNMKIVFNTSRMYTGNFPNIPIDKIYGVTTLILADYYLQFQTKKIYLINSLILSRRITGSNSDSRKETI